MTKPLLKKGGDSRRTSRLVKESHEEPSLLDEFPCIVYEADNSLRILRASPNVQELIGIAPERMIGVSWLFDEGVVPADRGLLKQKVLELGPSGKASLVHRLIDDRGRIAWVAHSLQKRNGHKQDRVRGSIMPLSMSAGHGVTIDVGIVSKFLHKIGNHFQLLNLVQHSIRRSSSVLNELELLQETTAKAIDLTHLFSNFLQQPKLSAYVNLPELLDSIIESRTLIGREKNVELVVRHEGPSRHAAIQCDPAFLEIAVGAVLDRAIEASPIGAEVLIRISLPPEIAREGTSRTLNVAVADDGPGVAADYINPSVEPFHADKPAGSGAGLGLACRYIEMHGGVLRAHSKDARGSVVEIALPVALAPDSETDESPVPAS